MFDKHFNAQILTIVHHAQRYETSGDWQTVGGNDFKVTVSELGDWRMEALIGLHELIEAVLCKNAGISQESVDEFDKEFEHARDSYSGTHPNCFTFRGTLENDDAEPGDNVAAPYYKQHQLATGIERILAAELGVDWNDYEAAVNAL